MATVARVVAPRPAVRAQRPRCAAPRLNATTGYNETVNPSAAECISGEWPMTWSMGSYDSVHERASLAAVDEKATDYVRHYMNADVSAFVCDSATTLGEARARLASKPALFITNKKNEILGMIDSSVTGSDSDIVASVMKPPACISPERRMYTAAGSMLKGNNKMLAVVSDSKRLLGVLSSETVEKALVV